MVSTRFVSRSTAVRAVRRFPSTDRSRWANVTGSRAAGPSTIDLPRWLGDSGVELDIERLAAQRNVSPLEAAPPGKSDKTFPPRPSPDVESIGRDIARRGKTANAAGPRRRETTIRSNVRRKHLCTGGIEKELACDADSECYAAGRMPFLVVCRHGGDQLLVRGGGKEVGRDGGRGLTFSRSTSQSLCSSRHPILGQLPARGALAKMLLNVNQFTGRTPCSGTAHSARSGDQVKWAWSLRSKKATTLTAFVPYCDLPSTGS